MELKDNIPNKNPKNIFRNLFLFFCFIFIDLYKPITTENILTKKRNLKTLQVVKMKVTYGKKVKIVNSIYIPDRVFINGVKSEIDNSGYIKNLEEGIYDVTMEWDKKENKYSKLFQNINSAFEIDLSNFDISGIKSIKSMFINCNRLEYINFTNFDTSSITDMASMFEGCSSLASIDVSNFVTSNVKFMESMFKDCISLTSLNLTNFITSKVERMQYMFSGCNSLADLDISSFDTSKVTNMESLFNECFSLTSLNISHFITKKVYNMNKMFYFCLSLKELDISNLDTSKVTNMGYMFSQSQNLTEINVSNFDTSKVENMDYMFQGCESLKSINISNFDISEVISMNNMFEYCASLLSLDLSNFPLSQKNMENFFHGCTSLISVKFSKDYKLVGRIDKMFKECKSLESLDLSGFDFALNYNFDYLFYGCYSLTSIDLSDSDTSLVTSMSFMFYGCKSLRTLNITNLKTSQVTSFSSMFFNCSLLTSLDLTSFNTSLVTDMSKAFCGCQNLRFLNFSTFNTSLVSDMSSMFEGCNSLTSLDISNFDTSLVTNMMSMFFGCQKLTSLNLSNFNIPKVVNIAQMFKGCTKLEYINLYNFTNGNISHLTDVFYGFLDNIIYCINNVSGSEEIIRLLSSNKCSVNDCSYNWKYNRKKIVPLRDICIEDCLDDEIYKYEFNDYCYESCPKGSHSSKDNIYICETYKNECTGKYPFIFTNNRSCSEECNCINFFDKICTINKYNNLSQSYLISNISKGIQDGIINKLLDGVLNEKIDLIRKENDTLYQITSSFNKNNKYNNNISFFDLGECEDELKSVYSILYSEPLIIFKIEKYIEGLLIPLIEYEIFNPKTKEKLDLNYCKNNILNISIYIPVSINESILDIYNPNSSYYNDICQNNYTEIDNDFTLYERQIEFNKKALALCQNNCIFNGFDSENLKVICLCQIQDGFSLYSNDEYNKIIFKFLIKKKIFNFYIFKCYKVILTKQGIINNIGNYIIFSFILVYIASAIYVYIKGYDLLLEDINNIIKFKLKESNKDSFSVSKKYFKQENSMDISSSSNKTKSTNTRPISSNDTKLDLDIIENVNNSISKNEGQSKTPKIKKNMDYFDYEINTITYKEAIENDKRTYLQYYLSLIKTNHILIFSFTPKNDYNSYVIKICLFFFNFALHMVINTLFYNDSMMLKIHKGKKKSNFATILPQAIYSILIASLINNLIIKFFFTQKNILEIKHENNKHNLNARIIISIKKIKIKLISFFSISILILFIFWYYISIFCALFYKTQILLIKNALFCYLISLIYPFIICLIPGIFRISALKGPGNCLYKFSQILELV